MLAFGSQIIRFFSRERHQRARTGFGHLTAWCAEQIRVFFDGDRRLGGSGGNAGDFAEEAIHRLAVRLRVAMWIRADVELDVLRLTEQRVELLQAFVSLGGATSIEVILLLCHDDDRLWGHGGEEIAVIEIVGQNTWRTLFHVLRQFVFGITTKRGHKAGRCPHRETRLHAAEPSRLCATAGVSGHAEMFRVDFLACEQVIERSHGIPHEPIAEKLTDQRLRSAHLIVLGCSAAEAGAEFLIQILKALTLTGRINDEAGLALPGESLRETLISLCRFAIERVAADTDHARDRAFLVGGQVEIAGDEKIRAALKDDVFDVVAIAFQSLRHLGIQRRFFGQGAKTITDALLHGLHISLGIGLGLQCLTSGVAA